MRTAVMTGAGQIGRGFIGMLLERSGYHVVFADLNQTVIDDINSRKKYTVHLVDTQCSDTTVTNISAISSLDERLADEYAGCEMICTAVGLSALPKLAPAIARGIKKRCALEIKEALNIIACENALRASSILRREVYTHLDDESAAFADRYVGFPDCAVDRIIPPGRDGYAADVVVERYHEWDVEGSGFKGTIPQIEGMDIVDDLDKYLERKLFALNGPNAVTACLGYENGYATINEALEDPQIYKVVSGMMRECSRMLEIRHGFSSEDMDGYCERVIARFKNPYIIDDCTRVAREPVRKLSPKDRLIAPLNYAAEYGIATPWYHKGIASVLLYDNPQEPQSAEMQSLIAAEGVKGALEKLCGIAADSSAAEEILREYRSLQQPG